MFEFDHDKSAANLAKHGIDFEEAQALWSDEERIEQSARSAAEERLLLIARLNDAYWCAVYTMRGPAIRIISVRRARKDEIETYEQEKDDRR